MSQKIFVIGPSKMTVEEMEQWGVEDGLDYKTCTNADINASVIAMPPTMTDIPIDNFKKIYAYRKEVILHRLEKAATIQAQCGEIFVSNGGVN